MKKIHLSFDDVRISFNEIAQKNQQLSDNNFFLWLKILNKKYNAKISLYLQEWGSTLANISDNSLNELQDNCEWLKLGIHTAHDGTDFEKKLYVQGKDEWEFFVDEIIRIGGSEKNIDRVPRLHRFVGSKECLAGMRDAQQCSAIGFLTADDDRRSYYLGHNDKKKENIVYDEELKLYFQPTDFRLDWLKRNYRSQYTYVCPKKRNAYKELQYRYREDNKNLIVAFTHEWQVYNYKGKLTRQKKWIEDLCKYAVDEKYNFTFPMYEMTKEKWDI